MTATESDAVKGSPTGNQTEAGARTVAFHIAWILPCLLIWIWFLNTHFQGLVLPDAMDSAQLARQIADGNGFTTKVVRPLGIEQVAARPQPADAYNAPLYPIVLAIAFNAAGGAGDRVVGVLTTAFGFLTAVLAFVLGARLLDRRAGWIAAALIVLHIGFLRTGISGLHVTLLATLVTLLFYVTIKHGDTLRDSFFCGALWALIYLTDYAGIVLGAPVLGMLIAGRQRWVKHVAVFLAGFVILAGPWLARNWTVCGGPFFGLSSYSVATGTSVYPGLSIYHIPQPGFSGGIGFATAHLRQLSAKVLGNLGAAQTTLASTFGLCIIPLLGLGLFLDLGGRGGNRAKWGLLAGLLLLACALAFGRPRFELFLAFLGVAAAVGAAALSRILAERGLGAGVRRAVLAAVLALAALPLAIFVLTPTEAAAVPRDDFEYLGRLLPGDAVVVTDQPWAAAWYADRTAVWLPAAAIPTPEEGEELRLAVAADPTRTDSMAAVRRAGLEPDAIFLSPRLVQEKSALLGSWRLLHDLMRQQLEALQAGTAGGTPWTPQGWKLAAALPGDSFLFLRAEGEVEREGAPAEQPPGESRRGAQ